jgi:hypothetical protein
MVKIPIGSISWTQKRTQAMEPPKPLSQQIKERWNHAEKTQTGMVGFFAQKAIGGAVGGLANLARIIKSIFSNNSG